MPARRGPVGALADGRARRTTIAYAPRDAHGGEILDALESRTELEPARSDFAPGAREYEVQTGRGIYCLEPMLAEIDPNWAYHLVMAGPRVLGGAQGARHRSGADQPASSVRS
jgi:hypothetical protein